MRTPLKLMMVPGIALLAAAAMHAQITNPIPNPVIKRGLSVEIRDVVRLPETRRLRPADQDVTPNLYRARSHPLYLDIQARLAEHVRPYDPAWREPKDAMAVPFYSWERS